MDTRVQCASIEEIAVSSMDGLPDVVKARLIIPCAFKPAAWSERLADVVVKSPNRMAAGARAAVRRRRVLVALMAMSHRAERPAQALAAKP